MLTSDRSHNFPTLKMCWYGQNENRGRGEAMLTVQEFYLRCARDDEFKATYAPFLDLEYVEEAELQEEVGQ